MVPFKCVIANVGSAPYQRSKQLQQYQCDYICYDSSYLYHIALLLIFFY